MINVWLIILSLNIGVIIGWFAHALIFVGKCADKQIQIKEDN